MRHKKNFNHLGRKVGHRKAMLSNMACSLIMHKRIETTVAKAKALKRYVEPLITRSKEDSTHSRRMVFSYLQDKEAVTELFREIGAKVGDRPGGYTRIIKLGNRLGDNADMCIIELVDYNEVMLGDKATAKKSTSRRRRGSKTKEGSADAAAPAAKEAAVVEAEVVEETVVEETVVEEAAAEEAAAEVVEEVVAEAVAEEETEAPAKEESKDDAEEEKKG
ncbi:MAG: 50S ribosomal protein L17 [Bacteroides sp.]|nr:50S ribosomal protein L17 [Bacteroides sp.]